MNAQILIKTANDWFEFTKSKTGQLDFVGKWELQYNEKEGSSTIPSLVLRFTKKSSNEKIKIIMSGLL